jgi:hypothetical protein
VSKKTIVLDFTGNSVSLQNTYSNSGLAYNALPNIGNSVDGDDKLYLKGGEGSLAVISSFETPGELESIRKVVGWLMRPILFSY